MYEKELRPIEAVNSEVEAVFAGLSTQIGILKSSIDTLESRLHPVLPEKRVEGASMNPTAVGSVSSNLCPLARSIEMQVYKVSDIIEQVEVILKELRI